jgi:hypothetical protein
MTHPLGQSGQLATVRFRSANEPVGQGWHSICCGSGLKVPGAQSLQAAEPALANVPGAHGTCVAMRPGQAKPAGQITPPGETVPCGQWKPRLAVQGTASAAPPAHEEPACSRLRSRRNYWVDLQECKLPAGHSAQLDVA